MSRQLWLDIRQGLLLIVAAIERELKMEPRTADLRRILKAADAYYASKRDEQP
jgi:hypothetical protein